jgi:hypothetical protein
MIQEWRGFIRFVQTVAALRGIPQVRIEMRGDERCRELFEAFTRRHPRFRVIQNKRWGVALLTIPANVDDYPRLASRLMRRRVKHAAEAGFTFEQISALERIDEVLAIHRSATDRQGRPMHPDYLDVAAVRENLERSERVFGVADRDGVLKAYLTLRVCGEVAVIERLIGDAGALEDGVMYLLISGTVRALIAERPPAGGPTWFMYDMFPGASDGMRTFKHVIGCRSYRVTWAWRE